MRTTLDNTTFTRALLVDLAWISSDQFKKAQSSGSSIWPEKFKCQIYNKFLSLNVVRPFAKC